MKRLDRDFFFNEIKKLQEQFPRAVYSPRKLDLIYLAINYLDEKQLAAIVDFFIANSKFAPNVDEFKEKARSFNSQKEGLSSCEICTQGVLSVYHKKTGINYAFACSCLSGRGYPSYQRWDKQPQSQFTRIAPKKVFMSGEGDPYEGKVFIKK